MGQAQRQTRPVNLQFPIPNPQSRGLLLKLWWILICHLPWAIPAFAGTTPPAQPTVTGTVDLGYQEWEVEGSFPRFGQYLLPPENLFLPRLLLNSQDEAGRTVFQAQLYDLGEDYHRGAAAITPAGLEYSLHYRFDRARFFPEPTFQPRPRVGRRLENTTRFHLHTARTQFSELRFQHLRVAEPGMNRLGRLAYRADNADLRGIWPVGPGQIDLRYSWLIFADGTDRQPASVSRTYAAEYAVDLGLRAAAAASYARTDLDQARSPDSRIRVWRLAGAYTPGPQWDAQARYERRQVDLGVARSAYTRESSIGTLKVTYRPRPDLAVRLSYERRHLERLNGDQSRLEAPQWRIVRLTANWRGPRQLGVDAHYEWRDLNDNPAHALPRTGDLRPLTPDTERRFEIKANLPFATQGFAYALFRDRRRENQSRNVAYTLRTWGLGGFYQATPKLTVEATLAQDDWRSRSEVLNDALSDSRVLTLNGTYTLSPQAWVSASYSRYRSDESSQVDDDQLSLTANYRLADGAEIGLSFRQGDYGYANFPGLDYEAEGWQLRYSRAF